MDVSSDNTIEVVVLFGEDRDIVKELVNKLQGTFEDLGYGFGIINIGVNKIIELAKSSAIQYIELPKSLYLTDSNSNRAICAERVRADYGINGEGIVIGFVDTGIDYTHPAFRNEDGTTRIKYIYDLELKEVYNENQINEALKSNNPYSIVPSDDNIKHGTHVAGIACAGGNIPLNYYGVAPKSSIIMVKSGRGLFSLSTNVMRGINFLVRKSKEINMPLVINISLSTNDGAHNGTSLLEQYINTIARSEKVTIVIAAGNEGDSANHKGGTINKDNNIIKFEVAEDETAIIINLYKSILPALSIEITAPTGKKIGPIPLVEGYVEGVVSGNKYSIYNTGPRPFDINGEIGISLISEGNYIISGVWTIRLILENNYEGIYDMWLPTSEGLNKKTKFLQPTVNGTLGIPATIQDVISVGSYNYTLRTISSFSGRGRIYPLYFDAKPDLVAPGEGIESSMPNNSYAKKSGTSMATPHVSGIAALLMEWGILKGNDYYLFGDRLKYYLIMGTKKERTDVTYPNTSWGYGEVCLRDTLDYLSDVLNIIKRKDNKVRQIADGEGTNIFNENNNNKFKSQDFSDGLVEFDDLNKFLELNNIDGISATPLSEAYGIVYAPIKYRDIVKEHIKTYVDSANPSIFTLSNISPVEASGALLYHNNPNLQLNGTDVIIGIIDTGIDYLNEEFQKEDDTTRILRIWDQTIEVTKDSKAVYGVRLGKEFTSEEINEAINAKKQNKDPYEIVPSVDENGHGTMVAGIAAGRGRNPALEGVSPNCDLAIVKLKKLSNEYLKYVGINKENVTAYGNVDIIAAIRYFSYLEKELDKPMVVLLALETNIGPHDSTSPVSIMIESFSSRNTASIVVTGTGNEGNTDTHTSGIIEKKGDTSIIEIKVDKRQRTLAFEIWIAKPDIMSISIISPSGQNIERIPASIGKNETINFVYEGTEMNVIYDYINEVNGDEAIIIKASNLKEGIWRFKLHGDYIVNGKYDVWLPQRELLEEETRFLSPTQYVTLNDIATTQGVLSVAFYNQNNNAIVGESGRGYTRDGRIKPDVAAGGVGATIIRPGGLTGTASGSSIAAAIAAGICSLVFQWEVINKAEHNIYVQGIISYIIRGAETRAGDEYPNREWGYGIINIDGILQKIRGDYRIGKYNNDLFIRAPKDYFFQENIKKEDFFNELIKD